MPPFEVAPATLALRAGSAGPLGPLMGAIETPWHLFWATGVLSAFLDNAPTYLAFLHSLVEGEVTIEPLTAADLRRALEVLGDYADIGFVDATVVAMAERLKLKTIATTDRRHFTMVKPRHVAAFTLVPASPA